MTLFLFALLIVGAALAFIYFDSHRSAAAKLQEQDNREDDQPLDIETEIRRIQAVIQAGIVGDKYVSVVLMAVGFRSTTTCAS